MFITFKQHVFTITAIFAALGLGILIGSSIIGEEGLLEEQSRIITVIREDIKNLRIEKNHLLEQLDILEKDLDTRIEIEEKIFSLALEGLFNQQHYYLLYNDIENEKIIELERLLKKTGASISLLDENIENTMEVSNNYNIINWNTTNDHLQTYDFLEIDKSKVISYNDKSTLGLIYLLIKDEFDDRG